MKFTNIQQIFFFSLLIATTGVFLWMVGGYLFPVFWAIVIAIVFYPLYTKLEKVLKGKSNIASLISILAVIFVVVLPLAIIGSMIVRESIDLYQQISQSSNINGGSNILNQIEVYAGYLNQYGISTDVFIEKVREVAVTASRNIAIALLTFSQITFSLIISTAIMLYLLFFFFRDGEKIEKILHDYLPLGIKHQKVLFARFAETSRAVVKGTLLIAIIQGLLGGIVFWITGISNPALWGVAMAFLGIIPAIGPALIWVPAGILLIVTGSLWGGITILAVGTLLISLIDNALRPVLIGRGSKMPDTIALLATIGGLATFGVSGAVVGPIIAAFFLSLWGMFGEKYRDELALNE